MFYELATLTTKVGATAKALAGVEAYLGEAAAGRFLGCWTGDIGLLNRITVLRSFADHDELSRERTRGLHAANPFGCAEVLEALDMSSFAPFPWLPAVEPGVYGAFYELRGYELKPGGLPHTLEAWKEALPERQQISPCLVALHSLDGVPRIVHIWPAPSLEARSAARAAAVKSGVWPPRNGPAWLKSSMQSDILVPAAFSPLR